MAHNDGGTFTSRMEKQQHNDERRLLPISTSITQLTASTWVSKAAPLVDGVIEMKILPRTLGSLGLFACSFLRE